MKNMTFAQKLLCMLLLPFCLFGCKDQMDEHYEVPGWVKGSVWEELAADENGKYSTFLQAAELCGYRKIMEGKAIMTVMAPDNDAFSAYLSAHGYASVKDIPTEDLQKLVGFHLLYYSYNKGSLENFRPEGESAGDDGEEILDPGMYYKFRTRSANTPTQEVDPATGKTVTVYHLERFVPVFSHYYFASKKIDAKSNYEYFYPNSTWTGDNGFNVSDASVKDYGIICSNGYIYTIDRVLEPMETIYEEMKKNDKYSEFLAMYDQFSEYTYDQNLSTMYGSTLGVDSLFLHGHQSPLAPIALEWPVSNYQRLDTLAYKAYSLFAPSNTALENFFNSYWKNSGYKSIEDLDPLIVRLFLNEYCYGGSVAFPEEIRNGKIVNASGVPYNFNPDEVTDRKMCVNGSFYGLDKIDAPVLFGSVSGATIHDKNYINFLYVLNGSESLSTYGNQDAKFTLLVPTNDAFSYHEDHFQLTSYPSGNVLEYTDPETGDIAGVPASVCQRLAQIHTSFGQVTTLKTSGTQVVVAQTPYNYWFVKDGKVTCSKYFNNILLNPSYDPFVPFTEVTNNGTAWTNGKVYAYQADQTNGMFDADIDGITSLQKTIAIANDPAAPYYIFAKLIKEAGMVKGEVIDGLSGRVVMFIPSNEVLIKALQEKKIPGATAITVSGNELSGTAEDPIALKAYLSNYIMVGSALTTCPYPGSAMKSGEYLNYNGQMLEYTDNGTSLSVKLANGTTNCAVDGKWWYFPFCYNDGCFHMITGLLSTSAD